MKIFGLDQIKMGWITPNSVGKQKLFTTKKFERQLSVALIDSVSFNYSFTMYHFSIPWKQQNDVFRGLKKSALERMG